MKPCRAPATPRCSERVSTRRRPGSSPASSLRTACAGGARGRRQGWASGARQCRIAATARLHAPVAVAPASCLMLRKQGAKPVAAGDPRQRQLGQPRARPAWSASFAQATCTERGRAAGRRTGVMVAHTSTTRAGAALLRSGPSTARTSGPNPRSNMVSASSSTTCGPGMGSGLGLRRPSKGRGLTDASASRTADAKARRARVLARAQRE